MPKPSPFHERTSVLNESLRWKDWGGYAAACAYATYPEREYFALRHSAGLIDVSPLFKYEIQGVDAADFLSWVMTKNIAKLKNNKVTYCCWCDEEGKVVDDGTVTRLSSDKFRVTAAEPCFFWFKRYAGGFDVSITDNTEEMGVLSLQGPLSKGILEELTQSDLSGLKFFSHTSSTIEEAQVDISRTGYTGDLGYEIWVENRWAVQVYDRLIDVGRSYGMLPAGLDAMDITRIEAGFIMNGVDYFSSHHCFNEERKSTPYEIGLGWTVQLKRGDFIGKQALLEERTKGSKWSMMGLRYHWDDIEQHFADFGLPPHICGAAWRDGKPVYDHDGRQIGQATSGVWSPTLKQNIALATLESAHSKIGSTVSVEFTVEYERRQVQATVCPPMFFDPPRKKA
jgi:aminomethyltransferase